MKEVNLHLKKGCALPDKYPEPKVKQKNYEYALLLLEDYAGQRSETTAINQYFFHYLTFSGYPELAEMTECIAVIEMYHMELLAKTIGLLGVAPRLGVFCDKRPIYWCGSYVNYGKSLCDRLAADIHSEMSAIKQYRYHQKIINDPYIDELLERIILDEEHHLTLFKKAAEQYCPEALLCINERDIW